MVGAGVMDIANGSEEIRRSERCEDSWKRWYMERVFIGADSSHPNGIFAHRASDLVCMTNEEFKHWYGGRSDSCGSQEGC